MKFRKKETTKPIYVIKRNNKITENSEQSYKGKVKTHKYIKKWWVESDIKSPNLPLSLRLKGSAVTITLFITILEQNR